MRPVIARKPSTATVGHTSVTPTLTRGLLRNIVAAAGKSPRTAQKLWPVGRDPRRSDRPLDALSPDRCPGSEQQPVTRIMTRQLVDKRVGRQRRAAMLPAWHPS